jgi:RimJ/RimL family protein N-acetyltransferase
MAEPVDPTTNASRAPARNGARGAARAATRNRKGDGTVLQTLSKPEVGERPIINITGEKVGLGPMHRDLMPLFLRWDNDFGVSIFSGDPLRPRSKELAEADYEKWSKEEPRYWVNFVIYELATLRAIGGAGLRHLDHVHGTAEYGISIGEKDCWGKGYGTETTILILDYAFTVLGLHNVLLETSSYNERAIRAYGRAGFREIGRRRESQRWGTRRYDTIYMDCLASEFRSPLRPVIDLP